jgi:hypothetical protein
LEQNQLAGTFSQTGKQAADHHRASPCGERFGYVTAEANAAVSDDWYISFVCDRRRFGDGRDLRHSDAADHPRRANGPRSDPDFDRIGPGLNQSACPFTRGDVASNDVDVPAFL